MCFTHFKTSLDANFNSTQTSFLAVFTLCKNRKTLHINILKCLVSHAPVPFFFSFLLQMTFSASPYSDPILVAASMAQEQPEMLWVMGPVLAVILIIIIVIAILLFKK